MSVLCFISSVKYIMFQEEGSTSAREWTDKMQSQDRCVLICEFIIREDLSETLEISTQQSHF